MERYDHHVKGDSKMKVLKYSIKHVVRKISLKFRKNNGS